VRLEQDQDVGDAVKGGVAIGGQQVAEVDTDPGAELIDRPADRMSGSGYSAAVAEGPAAVAGRRGELRQALEGRGEPIAGRCNGTAFDGLE
jgi:hypothetical protein